MKELLATGLADDISGSIYFSNDEALRALTEPTIDWREALTLLDRYLTRQCVAAIATVIGVLPLTLLFALIEELDEDNANYGFAQAIEYLCSPCLAA